MLPNEWNHAMRAEVPIKSRYQIVEREARLILFHDVRCDGRNISTNQLVDMLYPVQFARGDEGYNARKIIYKALQALATRGLSDCCTRGEKRLNHVGKPVRPWLWHHPTTPNGETNYSGSISVKSCPTVKPRPAEGTDVDNDWIDANFDAVLWFLNKMTTERKGA